MTQRVRIRHIFGLPGYLRISSVTTALTVTFGFAIASSVTRPSEMPSQISCFFPASTMSTLIVPTW